MAPSDLEAALAELSRRKREQLTLLDEVSDLTRQLAEAIDRKDQVSVQMVLAMRDGPIRAMREIEDGIEVFLPALDEAEARRCDALLRGAPAETAGEEPLAALVARFRSRLESVAELDERLSRRMGGNKSFYHYYKKPQQK